MFDAYLKIDGIPGECQEENHKEWIQILSYSHGIVHRGTNLGGGGARGSSGKAEHQDFRFTKYVDKATPKLNLHCVNGNNLKKVTLEICRQVDTKVPYMVYTFEPCLVSNVTVGGSIESTQDRPVEEVSFNYTKVEWKYNEVSKDNQQAGSVEAYHDLSSDAKGG